MNRQALNTFHFIFYGLSSLAFLRMVGSTWYYGYFFTPFPTILTVLSALTGIAAIVSLVDMLRPIAWLGETMPLEMRRKNALREAALFLCLVPFIYLSFAFNAKASTFDGSPIAVQKADFLNGVDGMLFGAKKAERGMARFARYAQSAGQYDVADHFLHQRLTSMQKRNAKSAVLMDATVAVIENHISMREKQKDCVFDKCDDQAQGEIIVEGPGKFNLDTGSVDMEYNVSPLRKH